jgi:hypothetical protein
MTISSTNRVAGPFSGDGSTATFPFSFKVFRAADLYVVTLVTASGAIANLALTTDYTVALNADQDSSPGGTITLAAGDLAVGSTLSITTDMAALQGLDLTNGGGFYPDVVNAALDTLTILVQQLLVQAGLALQVPIVDAAPVVTLPPAAERAGKLLMFDTAGNLTLVSVASGSIVPGAQTAAGTIDGANATFTFAAAAGATPSILVFAGGVFQDPATDYGAVTYVSGTSWRITFTNAPANGPIKILMLG